PRGTETPYALNVDRRTDTVWICGTQSDTLIRFEPASERFTVYPLPTRVTYTREIEFGPGGAVWTSNSNLPAWQIEGALPKVIRLEPDGAGAGSATLARNWLARVMTRDGGAGRRGRRLRFDSAPPSRVPPSAAVGAPMRRRTGRSLPDPCPAAPNRSGDGGPAPVHGSLGSRS